MSYNKQINTLSKYTLHLIKVAFHFGLLLESITKQTNIEDVYEEFQHRLSAIYNCKYIF